MGVRFNHTDGFACNVSIPDSLISTASLGVLPGEMGEGDFNTPKRDGWILLTREKKKTAGENSAI